MEITANAAPFFVAAIMLVVGEVLSRISERIVGRKADEWIKSVEAALPGARIAGFNRENIVAYTSRSYDVSSAASALAVLVFGIVTPGASLLPNTLTGAIAVLVLVTLFFVFAYWMWTIPVSKYDRLAPKGFNLPLVVVFALNVVAGVLHQAGVAATS